MYTKEYIICSPQRRQFAFRFSSEYMNFTRNQSIQCQFAVTPGCAGSTIASEGFDPVLADAKGKAS